MSKYPMFTYVIYSIIFCVFSTQAGKSKHFESFNYTSPFSQNKKRNYSDDVLRSITTQTWNASVKMWQSTKNTKLSYENGNLVEENTYVWSQNDEKWNEFQKVELNYNSRNYITSVATKVWIPDSSKWIDLVSKQFTYDESKKFVEEILTKENFRIIYGATAVDPGLHDIEKQTNTFKDGYLEKVVVQAASPSDSIYELEKNRTMKYTWDDNEQLTMELIQQWVSVVYMDKIKNEFYYCSNGFIEKERQSIKMDEEWVPVSSSEYTYNDYDSLETTLLKNLDTAKSELVNYVKISYEYNSEKSKALTKTDLWINEDWNAYEKSEFTYENNLLAEEIHKMNIYGIWNNVERYLYEYTTPINGKFYENPIRQDLHFFITSLPSLSILTFSAPVPSVVSIDIYDVRGKYISSIINKKKVGKGVNKIVWNRKNSSGDLLAPGTYYVRLRANEFYNIKKTMITN